MPQRIVDLFEAIDVDKQYSHLASMPPSRRHSVFEAVIQ
jgi:hypothetical protein